LASSLVYKVHPAIGVARVGNAPADFYFIGPEHPGVPAAGELPGTPVPPYKHAGAVKPQAARFRVFEYQRVGGKLRAVRELTYAEADVVAIEWQVHLANRKASFYRFDGLAGEGRRPAERRNQGVPTAELEIDPGPRSIAGPNRKGVEFTKGRSASPGLETWPEFPGPSPPAGTPVIDYLGELRTDAAGRLIVIGGRGHSATNRGARLNHYANNDAWFDDVSDGPIRVRVTLRASGGGGSGEHTVEALGAWVLVAPPDFAPPLANVVTLYDLLYDIAARELTLPAEAVYDGPLKALAQINAELKMKGRSELQNHHPSFDAEIHPILRKAIDAIWLFQPARHAHTTLGADPSAEKLISKPGSAGAPIRTFIFQRLRSPPGIAAAAGPRDMPRLLGDDPYAPGYPHYRHTLTRTQYLLLERWAQGRFTSSPAGHLGAQILQAALRVLGQSRQSPEPAAVTPWGLDRAALENCAGGAFYPGIEVGWQIRHKELFLEPFRLDLAAKSTYWGETHTIAAGHFSRQMATPWQADFRDCKSERDQHTGIEFGWWPGQRPDWIYANKADAAGKKMVPWHRPTTPPGRWSGSDPTTPTYEEMVAHWHELGFVVGDGHDFVESERAARIP
jgi:hypothetical protein